MKAALNNSNQKKSEKEYTMLSKYIQLILYSIIHLMWSLILAYIVRVGDASIYCELICYLVALTGILLNIYLIIYYYREYKPELFDYHNKHTKAYVNGKYRGIFYIKINICIIVVTLIYIIYDTTLPL